MRAHPIGTHPESVHPSLNVRTNGQAAHTRSRACRREHKQASWILYTPKVMHIIRTQMHQESRMCSKFRVPWPRPCHMPPDCVHPGVCGSWGSAPMAACQGAHECLGEHAQVGMPPRVRVLWSAMCQGARVLSSAHAKVAQAHAPWCARTRLGALARAQAHAHPGARAPRHVCTLVRQLRASCAFCMCILCTSCVL